MALVLIVEDERSLVESLELFLKSQGFRTEHAFDGEAALTLFRAARPDIVLLDVMLPKSDGFEVLKRIRAEAKTPVIMLTAKAEEIDKLLALGLGADDYLVKPYSLREVAARVQAVLRRTQDEPEPKVLRVGPLEVDLYSMVARAHSKALNLTPTEFRILHHLALTPGRAVGRQELIEAALPEGNALESAVNVHLKNLRAKLEAHGAAELLVTVRGVGYRLSP